MLSLSAPAFAVDETTFRRDVDRVPFGFDHRLSRHDAFAEDSLRRLAACYGDRDAFVADGAPSADTPFYAVRHGMLSAADALARLDTLHVRILLKRPENYDTRFRRLLDDVFAQVAAQKGGQHGDRIVRLESSVLISSRASITPFHFDPEISFFFQIAGPKVYHVYAPAAVTESELERFYVKGIVNIGELAFGARERAGEYVFELHPGKGLHQPQNAPHWVETRAERSVSYVVSFETAATRARGHTRSFNHYVRSLGLRPAAPGAHPSLDAVKASTMRVAIPLRKSLANAVRHTRRG